MSRQRGMVLLLALMSSLLLGLFATSALREALLQSTLAGNVLASARALEQAEASLLAGAQALAHTPLQACSACVPPADPHNLIADQGDWQASEHGFFLVQRLGVTTRAVHVPQGTPVTLYRVTAVSREARARQVIEAIYAQDSVEAHPPQRIVWRQRFRESSDAARP
ncbi:hypothetical protein ACE1YR_13910 [Pseudomonas sp. K1(2024)]|uniref:Type IV pilus assembly protein PilX n=2 Tax=Pseudomonas TaxID=286 RepID=A0AAI8K8J3_9PSED|nr:MULTISPECIES: hypothetical protein [Pseudomonas]AIZ31606.1 hypothetical protein NJ69_00585 [Pseudomonas parafulva]AXO87082.1 hypothetical protein DZC75_03335 [Pseudomonas parafulva]MDO7903319.1 hypothetical protein [Pseudomonas sp. K13]